MPAQMARVFLLVVCAARGAVGGGGGDGTPATLKPQPPPPPPAKLLRCSAQGGIASLQITLAGYNIARGSSYWSSMTHASINDNYRSATLTCIGNSFSDGQEINCVGYQNGSGKWPHRLNRRPHLAPPVDCRRPNRRRRRDHVGDGCGRQPGRGACHPTIGQLRPAQERPARTGRLPSAH